jgi:hypothetical protein
MGTTARHEGYICPSRLMFPHRIALHPRYGCCRLQAADDADVGKQIHVGHHLKVPVIYMLTIDNLGLWALCLARNTEIILTSKTYLYFKQGSFRHLSGFLVVNGF